MITAKPQPAGIKILLALILLSGAWWTPGTLFAIPPVNPILPPPPVYGTEGPLHYEETPWFITILSCDPAAASEVNIPAYINGKPVEVIGERAFFARENVTSVTLPETVRFIGESAFEGAGLTSITLPGELTRIERRTFSSCISLSSVTIPESVVFIDAFAFAGCTNLDAITLPSRLSQIHAGAFSGCLNLTRVTLPRTLTYIGGHAFNGCTGLQRVIFAGDAPFVEQTAFQDTTAELVTYRFEGHSGFGASGWDQLSLVNAGDFTALKLWLLEHGLNHDADPANEHTADGVSLLMAYALNLDPGDNPSASLPQPAVSGAVLKLPFYAKAEGISYFPETSRDLIHWTSAEVVSSEPDSDGVQTASVPLDLPARFLRLRVAIESDQID